MEGVREAPVKGLESQDRGAWLLILVKSIAWTAVAALVGAATGRYWLAPGRPRAVWPVVAAALAVPVLGAVELWLTLVQVLPGADLATWRRYATTTAHGDVVLWRSVAAVALAVASLALPRRWWPVVAGLGVWLCLGFSRLSHSAAMGGTGPLLVDLAHLLGAVLWAGAVWRLAVARERPDADEVGRLSRLATWVVVGLAVTGVLNALVHASEPDRFFASRYAVALAVKVALVALTLALAAVNRFVLLPRARRGQGGIAAALWVESALLLAVLVATGWLTTSPVPHGAVGDVDVLENARRVLEHLGR